MLITNLFIRLIPSAVQRILIIRERLFKSSGCNLTGIQNLCGTSNFYNLKEVSYKSENNLSNKIIPLRQSKFNRP